MIQKILEFYQRYLSVFSHGSCRYIPTCSEYAKWQFDNNSFFKAIYFTITRVLSCNKLFAGGFHYPKVYFQGDPYYLVKPHKQVILRDLKTIKYWYIPVKNTNLCLVTKNWEFKI